MKKRTLGEVSEECRQRLVTHYGPGVSGWLDAVPTLMERAAERWKLTLRTYHNAGHASVVVTAGTFDGRPLLLKAWADPTGSATRSMPYACGRAGRRQASSRRRTTWPWRLWK
ncbi:hypothetical protein GCM10023238_06070 [Streptomyces heliomycini]